MVAAISSVQENIQMNTRISLADKHEGDAIFEKMGITPSQAVRGLYKFAIKHRNDPAKISEVVLGDADKGSRDAEKSKKALSWEAGRENIAKLRESIGLTKEKSWREIWGDKSYKEILEETCYMNMREKESVIL